jgi:SET domain-containing protein
MLIILSNSKTASKYAHSRTSAFQVRDELYVEKSQIQGMGIYSKKNLGANEYLMAAIIDKSVTPPAGMVNHSWTPNCKIVNKGGDNWDMYAIQNIRAGTELTMNYNETPSYILDADPRW